MPEAETPERAAEMARYYLKIGLDGIKLFTGSYKGEDKPVVNMEAAIAKAAVDVAHAQGKPVFAHPQNTAGIEAVIAAGVDVMAHTVGRQPGYPAEQLARFKQQGIALTPTLSLFAKLPVPPEIAARIVDNIVGQLKAFRKTAARSCSAPTSASSTLYDTTLEYELMHRALSERQVLASLTTNPAGYFKAAKKGRVEKGFDADLVVLDGDPLADVKNLAKVAYTIRAGKVIYQKTLTVGGTRYPRVAVQNQPSQDIAATCLIGFICIHRYRIVRPEFIAAHGKPDTRCVNYSMKSPDIRRSIRRRRCDAPRARPSASGSTRRPASRRPTAGFPSRSTANRSARPPAARSWRRSRAIAEAIAAEWNAQGETIDPLTMPLTRFANSVAEVADRVDAVADDVAKYLGSDLLFYRAGHPEALVAREAAFWDPVLSWAANDLGAHFILSEGIVHVDPAGAGDQGGARRLSGRPLVRGGAASGHDR